jgi:hypothetical protein
MKHKIQPTHTQPTTEDAGVQPPADKTTDTTFSQKELLEERVLEKELSSRSDS